MNFSRGTRIFNGSHPCPAVDQAWLQMCAPMEFGKYSGQRREAIDMALPNGALINAGARRATWMQFKVRGQKFKIVKFETARREHPRTATESRNLRGGQQ